MGPFGAALLAYFQGREDVHVLVRRDDDFSAPLPMALYFRGEDGLSAIDRAAVHRCRGKTLDIGAEQGDTASGFRTRESR